MPGISAETRSEKLVLVQNIAGGFYGLLAVVTTSILVSSASGYT